MVRHAREIALRVLALVGLATSALLVRNKLSATPLLCGAGGGCQTVQASKWAAPLGVPLPYLGVAFFALALAAALWPRARRAVPLLGLGGGLGALAFLVIQAFVINQFCQICLVVDAAALGFAGLAVWRHLRPPPRLPGASLTAAVAVLLTAAPLIGISGKRKLPPGPPPAAAVGSALDMVRAESRAGLITVIEFADFECPFCRAQHEVLAPILQRWAQHIHFVRKQLPLPMHSHAAGAARAALCAEQAGRGDAMADILFAASDLSDQALSVHIQAAGLDVAATRTCMISQAVTDRLEADKQLALAAGLRGLPTIYIGAQRLTGQQSPETLENTLKATRPGPPPPAQSP